MSVIDKTKSTTMTRSLKPGAVSRFRSTGLLDEEKSKTKSRDMSPGLLVGKPVCGLYVCCGFVRI